MANPKPKTKPHIAVGQVWEDEDVNYKGRRFKILEINGNKSVIEHVGTGHRTELSATRLQYTFRHGKWKVVEEC